MSEDVSFNPAKLEPVDLSGFDNEFEAVKPASSDAVPDHEYTVRVNKALLGYSKNGTPMLKWDLVIVEGEYAGRHLFKNSVITTDSLPYLKRELQTVGLEQFRLSDLNTRLADVVGVVLNVAKKTNDKTKNTNVYFNSLVDASAAERASSGDEPF